MGILFLHTKQSTTPTQQSLTCSLANGCSWNPWNFHHPLNHWPIYVMHYLWKNKCAVERIRFTLQKINHHLLLGILPFKANLQKNYTHTQNILSFQNQCLLIVEPLPCSTTCIVFLHSTKKTTNIILNFHIELIVSLSPPQSFLSKTFLWMTRRQKNQTIFGNMNQMSTSKPNISHP
jgi:hypothetical protein